MKTRTSSFPPAESEKLPRRRLLRHLRPRTLDLYVTRLYVTSYLICLVSFVGLFVLVEAFSKLDRFIHQDSSLIVSIFRYHVAMVPTVYTNYLGPIVTLAAAMFTLTLLNRQNELTPVKAAGVSTYRLILPIFVLAAGLAAFGFFLQERVIPHYKEPIRAALALARGKPLHPQPYFDWQNGYLIRVQEYSTTLKMGRGVEITESYPDGSPKRQLDAQQMEWMPSGADDGSGSWMLYDASIQHWDDTGNLVVHASAPTNFERLKEMHKKLELKTSLRPIDLEASDLDISYLSWSELKTQYQRQPYHRHLAVKLHHHFAFPLSHIILLLLGVPFVLNIGDKNLFLNLAASFAICALFHFLSSVSMNIANHSEVFSPVLAAWLPVLLFGSLGVTLFDHLPT